MLAWLKRFYLGLKCLVFCHDFVVVQEFSESVRKLRCERCGRYFGMNDRVRCVVEWDEELEQMHCEVYELSRTNR